MSALFRLGTPEPRPGAPVVLGRGGPLDAPTAAPGRGLTSPEAIGFRRADGGAAEVALAEGLRIPLGADDELVYAVFPEPGAPDRRAATGVALDLVLDDGTRLSALGARDQYGVPVEAAAQRAGRGLLPGHWNRIAVPLEPAAGRAVVAILLVLDDHPGERAGWLDAVTIGRAPAPASDPVDLVDTRRGSNSSRAFSRGNAFPATAVPHGMNLLTPLTDARSEKWLYEYARANDERGRTRLEGLGISHQPSPWMGDRNQLALMPVARRADGSLPLEPAERAAAFGHDAETARPHEYAVRFDDGMTAAMTPTTRGGVLRASHDRELALVVDRIAGAARLHGTADGFEGWVDGGTALSAGRSRMFVAARIDPPPRAVSAAGERIALELGADARRFELRFATSFLGIAQARENLRETDGGYEAVRAAARAAWAERLGVLEVEATGVERASLYSALYRLHLYPNRQHEETAEGPRYASPTLPQAEATEERTGAVIRAGRVAVNNGFWDTYRTVWPAYALLAPELAGELIEGFLAHHRDSGWIPRWSSPGHADLMTGTSAEAAFADALLSGAPVSDPLEVYEALLASATVASADPATGRKGGERAPYLGFVPADVHESVSWTTENAINDAALAALAAHLAEEPPPGLPASRRAGLRAEARYLRHRAAAYRELFDPETGFLRERDAAGRFGPREDFDPRAWGGAYTETNAWTFAFHAPHDPGGLALLHGGRAGLAARLEEYFATPERADRPGTYPGVIHEMVEAREVDLGQCGLSNQPAHAIPYLPLAAGRPEVTQRIVRDALARLFRGGEIGQGWPGDEDNGELSAWYLFSALGLYPLAPGSGRYALGSPLVRTARLRRPGGELRVVAHGQGPGRVYVTGVLLDGEPLPGPWVERSRLRGDARLEFFLSERPSDWGRDVELEPGPASLRDLVTPGALRLGDGTPARALGDDDARTALRLDGPAPELLAELPGAPAAAVLYTLTSGADPGLAPRAWTLEGETEAGWVVLDERAGEDFDRPRRLRPFEPGSAPPCRRFRWRFAHPVEIAEVELLAE